MWTEEHSLVAADFLSNKNRTKLVMYMDSDLWLVVNTLHVAPLRKVKHLQYFIKADETKTVTADNIGSLIQYGVCSGTAMDSLLNLMNGVYLQHFLQNKSWPESLKKDFTYELHRFMASLTTTAHEAKGHTVLYLPEENLDNVDVVSFLCFHGTSPSHTHHHLMGEMKTQPPPTHTPHRTQQAAADKDLTERLETTLLQWYRQIKDVVTNQETSHHVDDSGPLEEIEFWQLRTQNLSGRLRHFIFCVNDRFTILPCVNVIVG